MTEKAWVVHQIPGRLRLRFVGRRQDEAFFAELIEQVSNLREVSHVSANPLTGSLLIIHAYQGQAAPGFMSSLLEEHGIELDPGEPPMTPVRPALRQGLERLNQYVGSASQQATDLRSLGVLFFFALSLVQIARGQFMAPATSLLWYALDLLRDTSEKPSSD